MKFKNPNKNNRLEILLKILKDKNLITDKEIEDKIKEKKK